ncbi:MAG TPA: glycosyltransferase family 2 protein [Nitrososphaeraceae archaeon]
MKHTKQLSKIFPRSEKKWMGFFALLIVLWSIVVITTLYNQIIGSYGLVDTSVDLSFITTPLLAIILIYTFVTILVFVVHILAFKKAKKYQEDLFQLSQDYSNLSKGKQSESVLGTAMDEELCSIIIPSKNEETVIRRTVKECLRQTYKKIEVIVVCHNCTDRTFEEADIHDSRVKVYDLKTKEVGKGIALNFGVNKSSGKFLLVLDGDGFLAPNFIELALPMFVDDYAAVQGKYSPSNKNYNFLTKLLSIEGDLWSTPFMTVRSIFGKRCPLGGTGYIIRKDALIEVGMFDNHLVDDFELTFRLLRHDYKIAFAPLCVDYDEKPPSLDIMMRQRSRWAKGFLSLLKTRIAEPTDLMGHISWLWPIAALSGLFMLFIPAVSAIHYMLYDYYPYTYSYISLDAWIALNVVIYSLQTLVLVKEHGLKAIKSLPYLPVYNIFSQYCFVTYIKALFVKSWANTKTQHGYLSKLEKPVIVRDA